MNQKKKVQINEEVVQQPRSLSQKSILKSRKSKTSVMRANTTANSSNTDQLAEYIKLQYPQISFESLQKAEKLEEFLRSFDYNDIRLVGKGATTITYKATNPYGQIVAVKILNNSQDLIQGALLYKQLQQDMADHLAGPTLY